MNGVLADRVPPPCGQLGDELFKAAWKPCIYTKGAFSSAMWRRTACGEEGGRASGARGKINTGTPPGWRGRLSFHEHSPTAHRPHTHEQHPASAVERAPRPQANASGLRSLTYTKHTRFQSLTHANSTVSPTILTVAHGVHITNTLQHSQHRQQTPDMWGSSAP